MEAKIEDQRLGEQISRKKSSVFTYAIKPTALSKFSPSAVKAIIGEKVSKKLTGQTYTSADASTWGKELCDSVRSELKDLDYDRYKFVVNCVIAEQRGAGFRAAYRCLWDPESDGIAQHTFLSESMFCVTTVYCVYLY